MNYIVHIVQPVSETTIGGADMHVLDLVSLQKNRKDIVPIVCIRWNRELKKRIDELGVICYCGSGCRNVLEYSLWLNKQLSTYNISLIHSHGYDANFLCFVLRFLYHKRYSNIKIVITSHGWIENTLYLKLKTKLDFLCHLMADAHIVCAQRNLLRLNDSALHYYIPNGIKPFKYCEKYGKRLVVGFVGRLSKEKRPDIFIRVAYNILQNNDMVDFYIYGEGAEYETIKDMIRSYGIEKNVVMKGQVSDRGDIYSNIDILLLPSDTESTPRVILEAQYCGKPVVATNVGDNSLLVNHNSSGFIVEKGDEKAMIYYIIKLLDSATLRHSMSVSGNVHIRRKYMATNMETAVYDVYKNLILL